jgi:D-beta-D-heptose 7-phosphate kinase / D-beta-D-heptose 1-phosphate adenosyltransferase
VSIEKLGGFLILITLFSNIAKSKLVVIGDIMLDVYSIGDVHRISPEAPVPVFWVKQKTSLLGGAGNVAMNLAKLGCHATILGVRGNDNSGQVISSLLRKNEIRDNLIVDDKHQTTTKTRIIGQRQQLIRLDEEEIWNSGGEYRNHLLQNIERALEDADGLILSDYCKGVLTGDLPRTIIETCKVKGIPVFVDPKRKAWERYTGATCITPNIAELEEITGTSIGLDENKLVDQARKLRKLYKFDWLLATRGPEGMCLLGPDEMPIFIKSTAREVFDVSGAGDTVIATFAAAVSCGVPHEKAAEISNVAAGIVVGKLGSQPIYINELESEWKKKESGVLGINRTKIAALDASQLCIKAWKAMGEKIVLTHGGFDLIHPGHIHNLNHSKELGDRLVVGLYSDTFIRKHKGDSRPILNQNDRADILSAFQCVDLVVLLDEEQQQSMIKDLDPDIFIKNGDDMLEKLIDSSYLQSNTCKVEMVSYLKGYNSSSLLKKYLDSCTSKKEDV